MESDRHAMAHPRTENSLARMHECLRVCVHIRMSSDVLARARCQCLLSVDDAYAELVNSMEALEMAQRTQASRSRQTYWFVSSDHGYNLGNHRLPSNKMQMYEHSIRPPFIVKGPGIREGIEFYQLASNVDLTPKQQDDLETNEGESWRPVPLIPARRLTGQAVK